MKVAITGSHGLIGRALGRSLRDDGHDVVAVIRPSPVDESPSRGSSIGWDPIRGSIDRDRLAETDAVVNLAGEGIASRRWTDQQRSRILDSRVQGTRLLATTMAGMEDGPRVLVNASAIGYYGNRGDEDLNEASPAGTDFLARVCTAWEAATGPAEAAGVRVTRVRTGIVLSPDGGVLAKVVGPARLGLSGPAGSGRQWMSWITLDDEVRAIRFLLEHELAGPYDLTAPHPVTNREFTATLGRAVHRPAFLRIPRLVTKLPCGVGPLAESLLFSGAKVHPTALLDAGFTFDDDDLDVALVRLVGR